jgi:hypothetical protein
VYAITDSSAIPEIVGLDGAALRLVGDELPFGVASEHDRLAPRLSEDDLWTHEAVVEALMDRAAVLPMRFDSHVAEEAELRRILGERREEFEALLAAVRGAVELGVRALLGEDGEGADAGSGEGDRPGTAYLLERARHQRRVEDALGRIHEPLAALSRQSRRGATGLGPGSFKAAYLVDRDRVGEFRARVEALDAELGSGRIVCTGPWPPYGFSSGERG